MAENNNVNGGAVSSNDSDNTLKELKEVLNTVRKLDRLVDKTNNSLNNMSSNIDKALGDTLNNTLNNSMSNIRKITDTIRDLNEELDKFVSLSFSGGRFNNNSASNRASNNNNHTNNNENNNNDNINKNNNKNDKSGSASNKSSNYNNDTNNKNNSNNTKNNNNSSASNKASNNNNITKVLNDADLLKNNIASAINLQTELIFNSLGSNIGEIGRIVNTTMKVSKAYSKVFNSLIKTTSKGTTAAAAGAQASGVLSSSITGLGGVALKVTGIVGLLVTALGLMATAGKKAYEQNAQVTRALKEMGASGEQFNNTSLKTANQLINIKNTWARIGYDLSSAFQPMYEMLIDFVEWISLAVERLTNLLDKTGGSGGVSGDLEDLAGSSGELPSKVASRVADITSSAGQSGFDKRSARNLGLGTYKLAIRLAKEYGQEVDEVAKKLADAWLTGSDAAKEYGAVVDDQVLAGYMASKGVDIVNTEITDAMRQYYRFMLLQEQMNDSNSQLMSEQIKQWKQLGMQIEKAKGKLFSFDEVINLDAFDPTIPEVGDFDINIDDLEKELGDTDVELPVTPSIPSGSDILPGLDPVTVPVEVEVLNPEALAQLQEALEYLSGLVPFPVTMPVLVPGLESIPALERALQGLGSLLPFPVTMPLTIPGLESIPALQGALNALGMLLPFPINLPVLIPGLESIPALQSELSIISSLIPLNVEVPVNVTDTSELVNLLGNLTALMAISPVLVPVLAAVNGTESVVELIQYCEIAAAQWAASIAVNIPSFNMVPSLLQYIQSVARKWTVDMAVNGLGVLQQAIELLNRVRSLLLSVGGKVGSTVSGFISAGKGYLGNTFGSIFGGVSAGFTSQTGRIGSGTSNSLGLIGDYSPTSSAAYGGGFGGALAADWDTWKTRLGFQSQTKEGFSTSELNAALGQYIGAQYDPFKQGSAVQVGAIGTAIAGGTALTGGYLLPALGELGAGVGAGMGGLLTALQNVFQSGALAQEGAMLGSLLAAPAFADGGIGTHEIHNATLFEDNKKEAVIPLESQAGIDYLAAAMKQAGSSENGSSNITINLTLQGIFDTDDRSKWQQLAERLAEEIAIQEQSRGSLGYGASY